MVGRMIVLAAVLAAWGSASASAQEVSYSRSGLYGGLAIDVGIPTFDSTPVDYRPAVAPNVLVGYRLLPRLALEGEVGWFGLQKFEEERDELTESDVEMLVATANAKVFVLTEKFQPYALLGVGYQRADIETTPDGMAKMSDDESGLTLRFGAGIDYYVAENVILSFQASYLMPTGSVDDFDFFSIRPLGLQYRF